MKVFNNFPVANEFLGRILKIFKLNYFTNTTWLFAEQFLRITLGLVVGIYIVRYLGPINYGVLSYVLAIYGLIQILTKLGIDTILVRDLVQFPEKTDRYLSTSFWLKLVSSFFCFTTCCCFLLFTRFQSTNTYLTILLFSLILTSFEVLDFYFQAKVKSKYSVLAKTTQLLLSSVLKIALVLYNAKLVFFVLIYIFDSIILSSLLFYYFKKNSNLDLFLKFDKKIAVSLMRESWPLILSGIAITIYMRIDQVLIKNLLGEYQVGIYSVAIRLIEIWFFIPGLIAGSLYPAIINGKKHSPGLFKRRMHQIYTLVFWVTFCISMVAFFFSKEILHLLYGTNFIQSADILRTISFSLIFVGFGVVESHWYLVENLSNLSLYRSIASAVIALTLNFFLISKYGLQGAAYGTLLAYIFSGYLFDLFNKKTYGQFILKSIAFLPLFLHKESNEF